MKLFLISQSQNNDWDTYASAVVAALDESDAKTIHPCSGNTDWPKDEHGSYEWCKSPEQVTAKYIGEADDDIRRGVILASFRSG